MDGAVITTIEQLEAVAGKTPPPMHLKVIDHLDAGALRWISQSPLMFATFGNADSIGISLAGGEKGFVNGDAHQLNIPLTLIDDPTLALPGSAFGSLFLLPGIGETLRINGRVEMIEAGHLKIAVRECYGHCAKALIRSDLWTAHPTLAPDDPSAFVASSRFLALATMNAEGSADLSPKGDPAGYMVKLVEDLLWFADRPGNRRMDSFRNIIGQPNIAMVLVIPGSSYLAIVQGKAKLTTNETMRMQFAVKDKAPLLAIRVDVDAISLYDSPTLARAKLWPIRDTSDIDPTKLFVEHIKLNKAGGVGASLARASLSIPGMTSLLKKGLAKDYKDNLY